MSYGCFPIVQHPSTVSCQSPVWTFPGPIPIPEPIQRLPLHWLLLCSFLLPQENVPLFFYLLLSTCLFLSCLTQISQKESQHVISSLFSLCFLLQTCPSQTSFSNCVLGASNPPVCTPTEIPPALLARDGAQPSPEKQANLTPGDPTVLSK